MNAYCKSFALSVVISALAACSYAANTGHYYDSSAGFFALTNKNETTPVTIQFVRAILGKLIQR
jgi:hypothetical protein